MGVLDAVAARVAAGRVVEFRPSGSSMVPLIRSRQLVTVAPVDAASASQDWVRVHCWLVPPLHVYCWMSAPSAVLALTTSRHLPLCRAFSNQ
jgi:hypothetical protein